MYLKAPGIALFALLLPVLLLAGLVIGFAAAAWMLSLAAYRRLEAATPSQKSELQVEPEPAAPQAATLQVEPEPRAAFVPQVGRNTLCPCGSGVKYKRCCIGKPQRPLAA